MSDQASSYNIAAIRTLLCDAFTPEELRRLCRDRPVLRPAIDRFGPGHGLDDMVDELIEFCLKRDLLNELLAAVKQENPRKFAKHAVEIGVVEVTSPVQQPHPDPHEPTAQQSPSKTTTYWEQLVDWIDTHKRTSWWFGGTLALLAALILVIQIIGGIEPTITAINKLLLHPTPIPSLVPTLIVVIKSPNPTVTPLPIITGTLMPTHTPTSKPTIAPTPTPRCGGGRIAFASNTNTDSNPEGDYEIYVMSADGSGQTQITNNTVDDRFPAWSPDGRIVFTRGTDIYVMNDNGSGEDCLTDDVPHPKKEYSHPDWSPDGRSIAFMVRYGGVWRIYTMNADGTAITRLTGDETEEMHPDWSPDGQRIAFQSRRDGNWDIFTINPGGTDAVNLTEETAYDDTFPAWSPDGRHIAYRSQIKATPGIFVMNDDGTGSYRVTTNETGYDYPAWSPDGQCIASISGLGEGYQFYVMNLDGSHQTRLTQQPISNSRPAWSP